MFRTNKPLLTSKELELLELFWQMDRPLTSVEILETPTERSWSDNYLPIMLKSLLKKGVLEICGCVQYGTQYARQFIPLISKEEYIARFAVRNGVTSHTIPKVVVALAEELHDDKDTLISELEDLIKELKESN